MTPGAFLMDCSARTVTLHSQITHGAHGPFRQRTTCCAVNFLLALFSSPQILSLDIWYYLLSFCYLVIISDYDKRKLYYKGLIIDKSESILKSIQQIHTMNRLGVWWITYVTVTWDIIWRSLVERLTFHATALIRVDLWCNGVEVSPVFLAAFGKSGINTVDSMV